MQPEVNTPIEIVRRFARLRVLVIGDALLDVFVEGTASRLCREAPVPVVDELSEQQRPGGAANAAANLSALGAKTHLVSLVGDDRQGEDLRAVVLAAGVEEDGIVVDDTVRTLRKTRILADDQYLLRLDDGSLGTPSAATRRSLVQAVERLFPQCDLVVISDYGHGTVTGDIIERLRQLRTGRPCPLIVDARDILRYADVGATLVTPNLDEARAAAGVSTDDPDHIALHLRRQMDAAYIAITLADGGGLLVNAEGQHARLPTYPIRNADDVGAGDSFMAATALAMTVCGDATLAAGIGIDAASIRCARHGHAVVTNQELLRRVGLSEQTTPGSPSTLKKIAALLDAERHTGRKIVFTNGVFDILHAGHVQLLRRAKSLGDILVVGINSDASVRRLKGLGRPVNREQDRLALIAALDAVDHAIIFGEDTPAELIRALRPDIHVKGGDYTENGLPEIDAIRDVGAKVEILPLRDGFSTTNVIRRIVSLNGNPATERAG